MLRVRKIIDGCNWVELAVIDSGIGMTTEQLAKQRPRCYAAECRDELSAPHSITSSASERWLSEN